MQSVQEQQTEVKNHCYMVDENGKEIPITTTMVQEMCIELLNQCRTVQKGA
ncbi:PA1571 family protein [Acinetobacter sp. HY1485]|uniref:PA1571 family protein n=1 Tax=Acinetobacter sp. HY1485 TaxID=2970918 RepID=UPI0022B9B56F|nr:PA1571 family protein [Acinetobacter sp. HY1485]